MLGGIGGRRRRRRRGRQRMRWWMTSLTWWTWVWVNSGSWWWTGKPGVLWFMGSQRVRHDWGTDLIWSDVKIVCACEIICLSWVQLFASLWTIAHQAPLSNIFSRQEYWSALGCPHSGDLPTSVPPGKLAFKIVDLGKYLSVSYLIIVNNYWWDTFSLENWIENKCYMV